MPAASMRLGDIAARRFVDNGALPVYAVAALLASFIVGTLATGLFTYDRALFAGFVPAIIVFLLVAFAIRWVGFARLAGTIEAIMLFLLVAFLAPLCAVILASTNLPLADDVLVRFDLSMFGVYRPALIAMFDAQPWLKAPTTAIYNTLSVQPFALLILLFAIRRVQLAWTMLGAWAIALAISLAVFTLFPAHGDINQVVQFVHVLDAARDGSLRRLDAETLTGIITFPSFHAAAALILAWTFAQLGRLARPMVALNLVMIVSAMFVGGHYFVDLVAGCAVAAAAILIARWCQSRLRA